MRMLDHSPRSNLKLSLKKEEQNPHRNHETMGAE